MGGCCTYGVSPASQVLKRRQSETYSVGLYEVCLGAIRPEGCKVLILFRGDDYGYLRAERQAVIGGVDRNGFELSGLKTYGRLLY